MKLLIQKVRKTEQKVQLGNEPVEDNNDQKSRFDIPIIPYNLNEGIVREEETEQLGKVGERRKASAGNGRCFFCRF